MSSGKGKKSQSQKSKHRGERDPTVAIARDLAEIAETHGVGELIYETKALTLTIRRGPIAAAAAQVVAAPAPLPVAAAIPAAAPAQASAPNATAAAPEAADDDHLHVVTSPFVGTFYRSPNPDSPAYVEPGQSVSKGQVLCIVEAMKLMNEIEADVAGTIETILVKNAESVEYGQPLFKINPS